MHNSITRTRNGGTLLLILMVVLLSSAPSAFATGATPADPQILPPRSHAYGATYGEWSARWWQWAFRLPIGAMTHPLVAHGAVDCSYGQSGKVWFLGGTYVSNPDPQSGDNVGDESRSCTIPAGTALFFPIVNAEMDPLGSDGKPHDVPLEELWKSVNDSMDSATNLGAQIDGRAIADLTRYRVQSPVFAITMPEDNLYQYFQVPVAAGTYSPVVADGIFLMLAPLPVGKHTIAFHGAVTGFRLNITYNITVTPHK